MGHCVKHGISCCDICNCLNVDSSNNTVTVSRDGCNIDITISPNNIDSLLTLNDGECITFVKEFLNGKLVITPILNIECIAEQVCALCSGNVCPEPTNLIII